MNSIHHVSATALLSLALLTACATPRSASAQSEGSIRVLKRSSERFLVSVQADEGRSPEDAGLMAMAKACEISRARSFTHMGVLDFRTGTESTRVQTRRGGTQYHGGTDGRAVGAITTQDEYRTVTWGSAVLEVVMMSERAALGAGPGRLADAMQIIDARSCLVLNPGN